MIRSFVCVGVDVGWWVRFLASLSRLRKVLLIRFLNRCNDTFVIRVPSRNKFVFASLGTYSGL